MATVVDEPPDVQQAELTTGKPWNIVMGGEFGEVFAALSRPFDAKEVKERPQGRNRIRYITARTVMNRLDDVLGPENWRAEYSLFGETAIKCRLTLYLPNGRIVSKEGIGGITSMNDPSDTMKTGSSDAMKRAAVEFGIGRYLYNDGAPRYENAARRDRDRDQPRRSYDSAYDNGHDDHAAPFPFPVSDDRRRERVAIDNGNDDHSPDWDDRRREPARNAQAGDRPPGTGRSLFAWAKKYDERNDTKVLSYLHLWGRSHKLPDQMIQWPFEAVEPAYREAVEYLRKAREGGQAVAESVSQDESDPDDVTEEEITSANILKGWARAANRRYGLEAGRTERFLRAFAERKGYPADWGRWKADELKRAFRVAQRKVREVAAR